MSSIPPDQFRRLFEYERDAHQRMLDSLRRAISDRRDTPGIAKAVDLAAHIATCRDMWLGRIRRHSPLPTTLFPSDMTVSEVERAFARIEPQWREYLDTLDEAELARECEYVSYEGGGFRNSVNDILIQLFGHSLYHRGQIALLLRRSGALPAATDFVFWSRSPAVTATDRDTPVSVGVPGAPARNRE
jgi:uncharacterized damage-inducible protein DinB